MVTADFYVLKSFYLFIYLLRLCIYYVCMCSCMTLCAPSIFKYLWRPEGDFESHEIIVTGSCEEPMRVLGSEWGSSARTKSYLKKNFQNMEKTLLNYHKYSSLNYITSILQYLLISVKGGLESVLRPFAGKKKLWKSEWIDSICVQSSAH